MILGVIVISNQMMNKNATNIELISAVISVIGCLLLSVPFIEGLYVITLGQIFWAIFGYIKKLKFLCGQNIIFFIINSYAIYSWTIQGIG